MGENLMTESASETRMNVGVNLRTQLVDTSGNSTDVVLTGCSHRVEAVNLGIISFYAVLSTMVIGEGVSNSTDDSDWSVPLVIAGAPGAKTKSQNDTELKVTQPNKRVAFRTVGALYQLSEIVKYQEGPGTDPDHYKSKPLDVFGTTAEST
jgi:hypothetical protein